MIRYEEGSPHPIAFSGVPQAFVELAECDGTLSEHAPSARAARTKQTVHVADFTKEYAYAVERHPMAVAGAEIAGIRTLLVVPMLMEGDLIGNISIYRQEVRPFTDKQIELVKNFAAQAVIAIENTRLLNELRQRTDDLTESLEQQTATSKVLGVISSSPGELKPVFQSMLENAVRICEASFGNLLLYEHDAFRHVALHNAPQAWAAEQQRDPVAPRRSARFLYHVAETKQVSHIADITAENPDEPIAKIASARTLLIVPMLKENELIGAIAIYRQEVRPFTEKQIELMKNFAAQAVIAIENTRLLNELRESLQQQTATADVLKIISSSPGDMKPVFESMLANALRICDAKFGHILLYDGERYHAAYLHEVPPSYREFWEQYGPLRPGPDTALARLARTKQVSHIPDLKAGAAYSEHDPLRIVTIEQVGARSLLAAPMLKENELVGAIVIYRLEVRPFTDKQVELLTNFAAQAVIAIENTRLLNELRESLQQQTATSEVLSIISSSPGELEPVFKAMLENAVRICEAKFGTMFLREGDAFRTVALHNAPPAYAELRRRNPVIHPHPKSALPRLIATRQVVHIADIRLDQGYLAGAPSSVAIAETAGARTLLVVPMLKDNEVVGAILIYRQEVRPFTDKQIELVKNFAAQAVIAIENARLLSELRQRTDDLSESLEQQTATSEVLKVISSSPGELTPVFDSVLANATQLCEASHGAMWIREGDELRNVAFHGTLPETFHELWHAGSVIRADAGVPVARSVRERGLVLVEDLKEDKSYRTGEPLARGAVDLAGMRTLIAVPMLKENDCVGAITIYRGEVKPFAEKQIELVQNFASQAVIAIENARLLKELRESLQQQTATSEVLKVISSSPGELQSVFQAMLENAVRFCEARYAQLFLYNQDAKQFHVVATHDLPPAWADYLGETPIPASPLVPLGRAATTKRPVHIDDIRTEQAYIEGFTPLVKLVELGGARTLLVMPILKENNLVGAIGIYRQEVRPFANKQIELVQNFAAQAVIAIENARLLNELRDRTRELAKSLEELRTTQDRLVQTQKLALLGQLTAGIAHEIKNPLNFVNNFSGISAELIDELKDTVKDIPLDDRARTEINELTDTLKSNFDKVVHHGRRADAIVKNMLQHSREGSGEHRVIDINALVEESLNLAWHGARAETQGFEIKLKQSFDPSAGAADVFPQDIRRALLNVISNGFYAAIKRGAERIGGDYEPTLTASTKTLGDRVEIRIRDNGTGMTPEVKEKMFNPFFTTKPTGEGTGLGLSISHDIIVKQHCGSIEVDTQPGEFTEIRVILPRAGALLPERS
jgi:GAF domain-containing protein